MLRKTRINLIYAITVVAALYSSIRENTTYQRIRPTTLAPPPRETININRSCLTNPFTDVVNKSFNAIIEEVDDWLNINRGAYAQIVHDPFYSYHDHKRFFPFEVMAECMDLQCIGGACADDHSKMVCGMNYLDQLDECVIYSIGGNNEWTFEADLLKRTKCHIHTFDCTGKASRFEVPNHDHLHFHHICLGAQKLIGIGEDHPDCDLKHLCGDTWTLEDIQNHFGHKQIDLLKLDIEGWEWPIFDVESTNATMPMQLLMEVHYDIDGHGRGVAGVIHKETMRTASDMLRFQSHLFGLGYVVVNHDDNPQCRHCTELTLLKVAC